MKDSSSSWSTDLWIICISDVYPNLSNVSVCKHFFMEIYIIFKTVGTGGIFEGAAACLLTSVAWHAHTVTLQHDAMKKKRNLDRLELNWHFWTMVLTTDAITYCFSCSVPVQFKLVSRFSVQYSSTDRRGCLLAYISNLFMPYFVPEAD